MIEWAGVRAADLHLITEHIPSRKVPSRKIDVVTVPGRSGDILLSQDAFSDYEQQYRVFVDSKYYGSLDTIMSAITEWIMGNPGYQILEDSFEPQIYRLAYIRGGEEFANLFNEYGEGTLTFVCDPRRFYKAGTKSILINTSGKVIHGPSVLKSKPIVKVTINQTTTNFSSNCLLRFGGNEPMLFKSDTLLKGDITGTVHAGYVDSSSGNEVQNPAYEHTERIPIESGYKYFYSGYALGNENSAPFVVRKSGARKKLFTSVTQCKDTELTALSTWPSDAEYLVASAFGTWAPDWGKLSVKRRKENITSFVLDTERHSVLCNGDPVDDCISGSYESLELDQDTPIFFSSGIASVEIIPRWFTI